MLFKIKFLFRNFFCSRCKCGSFIRLMNDGFRFHFDTYGNLIIPIYNSAGEAGFVVARFCPICGGKFTNLGKLALDSHFLKSERIRLRKLCRNISSVNDAISILGNPDSDYLGIYRGGISHRGICENELKARFLVYRGLSEFIELVVAEEPQGKVCVFQRRKDFNDHLFFQKCNKKVGPQQPPDT